MSKKTFEKAHQSGKKLLVQLKDNQKELKQNCQDIIRFTKSNEIFEEEEKNRSRIETRKVSIFNDSLNFIDDDEWKNYIKTVVFIERQTMIFDTKAKGFVSRNENSFYIVNIKLNAQQANYSIRNHWAIENSNHYVRDIAMCEDFSRIRKNPDNIARLRSFALNVLRKNKVNNIKGELYKNSLDYYRLYTYQHFI